MTHNAKNVVENGEIIHLVPGILPDSTVGYFGLKQFVTTQLAKDKLWVRLTQFKSIVAPGLILAKHCFRGLRQPLRCKDDNSGDSKKYIFLWKAGFDFDWRFSERFDEGSIIKYDANPQQVYVVIATPAEKRGESQVDFWIEHWSWVPESESDIGAPEDWQTRYEERVKNYGQ